MKYPMIAALALAASAASAVAAVIQQPQSPDAERALFQMAKGFTAELVASEPDVRKIVDIAFDDAGRMWALTAGEYPLDGNEQPEAARKLYEAGGADEILIFDAPWKSGPQKPRVFAGGLAMPMAILPYKSGVIVGHGPEILLLDDKDGDGRADSREILYSGFGIEDSHLMPHRFVRGPGGWIYMAQGAFNYSNVKSRKGGPTSFDQCKLARFKADGSKFEVVGVGLNNIWGIVLDRTGGWYIQEANDLGYPVVPFFLHASYPGIGDHKHQPWSPWQPALATFQMGGTGLSGLARSGDSNTLPAPWTGCFFIANPIINKIQTIRVTRDGDTDQLKLEPDLLYSSDPNFRPVAIHFGPDGSLYVVDWYNPIISHNEVPRTDPRRDKTRSRIWRIRHDAQKAHAPIDITRAPAQEVFQLLASESDWKSFGAWHQIADRKMKELAPQLMTLLSNDQLPAEKRVPALWSLEELGALDFNNLQKIIALPEATLQREVIRASQHVTMTPAEWQQWIGMWPAKADLRTRLVIIELLTILAARSDTPFVAAELLKRTPAKPASPPSDRITAAYVEFERSLIRTAWAGASESVKVAALSASGDEMAPGRRVLAAATEGVAGARVLAAAVRGNATPPAAEEFILLIKHLEDSAVRAVVEQLFADKAKILRAAAAMIADRSIKRGDAVVELLRKSLAAVPLAGAEAETKDILIQSASRFHMEGLAPAVESIATDATESRDRRTRALAALVEMGRQRAELCAQLARTALPGEPIQRTALLGLASLRTRDALDLLLEDWSLYTPALKSAVFMELTAVEIGSRLLLQSIQSENISIHDMSPEVLDRLRKVDDGGRVMEKVDAEIAKDAVPTLIVRGGTDDALDSNIIIKPPFTIEAWVRLEAPITNADGILGRREGADFNFADGRFRFYGGPQLGDLAIAKRVTDPDVWAHVAVTCNNSGNVILYENGEETARGFCPPEAVFTELDVARTSPDEGTRGRIAEFRIWSRAKTPLELGRDHVLRADALSDRTGLLYQLSLPEDYKNPTGAAAVERTLGGPPVMNRNKAEALEERFVRGRRLAATGGDAARGREVFIKTCLACHAVANDGGRIGPPLDGAGHRGVEGLLRATVTPSAAVESGYRQLVLELKTGERLAGFLASQDDASITVRRQAREDLYLLRKDVAWMRFESSSVMPEGLLDGLQDRDVADLLAYLLILK